MNTEIIIDKIKQLIKQGTAKTENFLEVEVGDSLIQVDGDDFEVGQIVKIKQDDEFIPAGTLLDGEHTIGDTKITIQDGVIVDVTEIITEIEPTDTDTTQIEPLSDVNLQSYTDYPQTVKDNAQKALDYANENGWGDCGTEVGKTRANQLAKGEPISEDTIKRMYSYLSRHKVDLDSSTDYSDGCGKLMYDAWGGLDALRWSERKLNEIKMGFSDATESVKLAELDERMTSMETDLATIKESINDYSKKMEDFFEKFNSQSIKFEKIWENLPAKGEIEDFKSETSDSENLNRLNPLDAIRNIRSKRK